MKQYIEKSALVAEIERRIKGLKECHADTVAGYAGEISDLERLLFFINTLETKEVDLEKEIELVKGDYEQVDVAWNNDFDYIARHFFELGLKAQRE